jgi:hypothetical protein
MPVLARHLLRFMQLNDCTVRNPTGTWSVKRGHLNKVQMPAYLEPHEFEEAALRANMDLGRLDPPVRVGYPTLLSVGIVDEITRNVDDVAEIWLQFSTVGAFLVAVNTQRQYDYGMSASQTRTCLALRRSFGTRTGGRSSATRRGRTGARTKRKRRTPGTCCATYSRRRISRKRA